MNFKKQTLAMGLCTILAACGGESAVETETVDTELESKINTAPVADAGDSTSVIEGEQVTLDASASYDNDADDSLSYEWQALSADVLIEDSEKAIATFVAPSVDEVTKLNFSVTVTDSEGDSSSDVVVITINPEEENAAPLADAGSDIFTTAGSSVQLNGSGSSDPEGDDLSYQWKESSKQGVQLSNADSAKASFTAPEEASELEFTLTVTDSEGLRSTDTVLVSVSAVDVNVAPVADAGEEQSVDAGDTVSLNGSNSYDANGDDLTYAWRETSDLGISISNASSASASFSAPTLAETATASFMLTVSDSEGLKASDSVSVTIVAEESNSAPVADAGSSLTVYAGDSVELDGSASSDADGDDLTYLWEVLSGEGAVLSTTDSATSTFTAPDVDSQTSLSFSLTVSDSQGESNVDTVTVTVLPEPEEETPSGITLVTLNGDSISVKGSGVDVSDSTMTITAPGTYKISGSLDDGQILVDSTDDGDVNIQLNGVDVYSSVGSAIYVMNADNAFITLLDGTENSFKDAATYADEEDDANAAIFSKDDLEINGNGSLIVEGNYNDAITGKDDLVIAGGNITVTSVDDGIRGKDSLTIENATITVNAMGDGLFSDNDADEEEGTPGGYVQIDSGSFVINAGGDAISAVSDVTINGGDFDLSAGGGSNSSVADGESAKGIKSDLSISLNGGDFTISSAEDAVQAGTTLSITDGTYDIASATSALQAETLLEVSGGEFELNTTGKAIKATTSIVIDNGSFDINSVDDAIHSNSSVEINGGEFTIATNDDGVHSDTYLTINGGDFVITESYEGLEATVITINDGDINLVSSDDGINVAGGSDSTETTTTDVFTRPGRGGGMMQSCSDCYLYINGGRIVVNANGDGLDANGSISMTDGVVVVYGPTENNNGPLDYDVSFSITGGFLAAVGSSGMAHGPDSGTQNSLLSTFSTQSAGTMLQIQDSSGNEMVTLKPVKAYASVAFSSPELSSGSYNIYTGGSYSGGSEADGMYEGGSYSGGNQAATVNVN